jgi:hypothetical protein
MDGAIYVLTRNVPGDQGELFLQNVTVFAGSADEARALVRGEFAKLRAGSKRAERPYREAPDFSVDRIELDAHKLLTHHITS